MVPASELHRKMLSAAEAFGHPQGRPAQERFSDDERRKVLDMLSPELRGQVEGILQAGRRIPEEVLGPDELRGVWSQ